MTLENISRLLYEVADELSSARDAKLSETIADAARATANAAKCAAKVENALDKFMGGQGSFSSIKKSSIPPPPSGSARIARVYFSKRCVDELHRAISELKDDVPAYLKAGKAAFDALGDGSAMTVYVDRRKRWSGSQELADVIPEALALLGEVSKLLKKALRQPYSIWATDQAESLYRELAAREALKQTDRRLTKEQNVRQRKAVGAKRNELGLIAAAALSSASAVVRNADFEAKILEKAKTLTITLCDGETAREIQVSNGSPNRDGTFQILVTESSRTLRRAQIKGTLATARIVSKIIANFALARLEADG